jgi:hypothetical protein
MHDPEKWKPVFPRDKRGTRLRGDHAQTMMSSKSEAARFWNLQAVMRFLVLSVLTPECPK